MAEETKELTTLDEYAEHFMHEGFKRVKESETEMTKTVTFRKFSEGDAWEAIVKQIGSLITVKQTLNGKPA